MGLVLLVLALAAAVSWYSLAGPGAYTTTPGLVGRTPQEATSILQGAGLGVREEQGFSDTVEKGRIASTDPGEGERVRKDGTVTVVVSQGIQTFPVPDLARRALDDAQEELTSTGLAVGAVSEEFSEDVAQGRVVRTDPAAGTVLNHDTPVNLVVSRGRQPIDVPGVVDQTQDAAEKAITDAGLVVGDVSSKISETVPKGQVISQSPTGGTLFRGDAVSLVVSSGPPLVTIPTVQGKNVDAVRAQLQGLGFTVEVDNVLGGVFGTVRSIDPGEGQQIPKGSTVTLTVV